MMATTMMSTRASPCCWTRSRNRRRRASRRSVSRLRCSSWTSYTASAADAWKPSSSGLTGELVSDTAGSSGFTMHLSRRLGIAPTNIGDSKVLLAGTLGTLPTSRTAQMRSINSLEAETTSLAAGEFVRFRGLHTEDAGGARYLQAVLLLHDERESRRTPGLRLQVPRSRVVLRVLAHL